ncbi:MAG: hypothetical protein V1726_05175 [Methanobacteriota archaeon]
MNTHYKIGIIALMVCIGFIPTTSAVTFEPSRSSVSVETNALANHSLLQYAVETIADGNSIVVYNGSYYGSSVVVVFDSMKVVYQDHLPTVHVGEEHKAFSSFVKELYISTV